MEDKKPFIHLVVGLFSMSYEAFVFVMEASQPITYKQRPRIAGKYYEFSQRGFLRD
jgi:hypothetical protein